MPQRDLILPHLKDIWRNDTGVVLSNAGNIFLEAGGGARTSWVPKKNWVGNEGTLITREAGTVAVNNVTDTFRGWPNWRREHVFDVDLRSPDGDYPYTKLFFEWRGEHVVDSTGFAIAGGAPANFGRVWFYSTTQCTAFGSFFEETDMAYATEPFAMSWSSPNTGKWYGPPSGATGASTPGSADTPWEFFSSMALVARSFVPSFGPVPAAPDVRNFTHGYSFAKHPLGPDQAQGISKAGLLWGFNGQGTGAPTGFPRAGDKLNWVFEVGYPKGIIGHMPGSAFAATPQGATSELSIAGLRKVYVTFREGAPATGVTPWWLDFTNASITVRGRIKAILVP